jgi:hypothetical protein
VEEGGREGGTRRRTDLTLDLEVDVDAVGRRLLLILPRARHRLLDLRRKQALARAQRRDGGAGDCCEGFVSIAKPRNGLITKLAPPQVSGGPAVGRIAFLWMIPAVSFFFFFQSDFHYVAPDAIELISFYFDVTSTMISHAPPIIAPPPVLSEN